MPKVYEFDAVIHEMKDNGGAYVVFPWDIREQFGKGRVKVHAEFDGVPYDGSIVNMGHSLRNGTQPGNRLAQGHSQFAQQARWRHRPCDHRGTVSTPKKMMQDEYRRLMGSFSKTP